ncbi:hypothetical protein CSOJ01_05363 [Colletotrichum sojae]|uniref:Uncharacterized protein n=1 Tax=Colletotrichum sojae TaxID=2175907 RepID=A0A8H6JFE0_9PEZI|nr:hypothetical protein CSOJ01_05363 [Colletotrichum sojae]
MGILSATVDDEEGSVSRASEHRKGVVNEDVRSDGQRDGHVKGSSPDGGGGSSRVEDRVKRLCGIPGGIHRVVVLDKRYGGEAERRLDLDTVDLDSEAPAPSLCLTGLGPEQGSRAATGQGLAASGSIPPAGRYGLS